MVSSQEIIKNKKSEQLTVNQYINTTDLTVKQLKQLLKQMPFTIQESWEYAVIGHIRYFGLDKVMNWARISATKNKPEHYFMSILTRQRYGGK